MAKTHFSDLEVAAGTFLRASESIDSDTAISITSGMVTLDANLCITALAVTLPDTVAGLSEDGGDDFKLLTIVDTAGAAHTVIPATPYGNGGANEAKATFSGVIGDTLDLLAYQGYWYIVGKHQ